MDDFVFVFSSAKYFTLIFFFRETKCINACLWCFSKESNFATKLRKSVKGKSCRSIFSHENQRKGFFFAFFIFNQQITNAKIDRIISPCCKFFVHKLFKVSESLLITNELSLYFGPQSERNHLPCARVS